jgi:hypothetical protein
VKRHASHNSFRVFEEFEVQKLGHTFFEVNLCTMSLESIHDGNRFKIIFIAPF